jgi:hypothetical protein
MLIEDYNSPTMNMKAKVDGFLEDYEMGDNLPSL